MSKPNSPMPGWVTNWLMLSTVVCVYDGLFCLLRPHSMGDGAVAWLFYAYKYYIPLDPHYGDPKDSFVWTQAFGNIIECSLNVLVLVNALKSIQMTKMLCCLTCIMCFWKSTLFFLYSMDVPNGFPPPVESFWPMFAVLAPTVVFIVVPLKAAWTVARDFLDAEGLDADSGSKDSDQSDQPAKGRYNLRKRHP